MARTSYRLHRNCPSVFRISKDSDHEAYVLQQPITQAGRAQTSQMSVVRTSVSFSHRLHQIQIAGTPAESNLYDVTQANSYNQSN